ncbi:MAG TPA: chemotaxis protein CheX [Gemmatimonadales bacterium]|nr:chemotaxis protein CheX [Gemmatimonadales bacterium]
MSATVPYSPEFPFTSRSRMTDRDALLTQIVTSVWAAMLELPVLVRQGRDNLDGADAQLHTLTGTVHVTGAWDGTVAVAAPILLAGECAARLLGRDPGSLTLTDLQDAWGELVNVVAGNLKALVPPSCHLSMPAVVEGTSYTYRVPRSRVLNELTFACLGKRIRVTVLERDDAAA